MACPSCKFDTEASAKFCQNCGTKLSGVSNTFSNSLIISVIAFCSLFSLMIATKFGVFESSTDRADLGTNTQSTQLESPQQAQSEIDQLRAQAEAGDAAAQANLGFMVEGISFESEDAYQSAIGNPGFERSTEPAELMRKKLGTSIGSKVVIPRFFIWSLDDNEWESGGRLFFFNDGSLGSQFLISCALSPSDGDKFIVNRSRRLVDIEGTLKAYSSSTGLLLDPCIITWDETLDPPKRE